MRSKTSGRIHSTKDLYWATALDKMQSPVQYIIKMLFAIIARSPELAKYLWPGSGWRSGSAEHNSGRAIDIMITENTGMRPSKEEFAAGMKFVNWVIANGLALRVQWVLFSIDGKVTWSYNMDRGSWTKLADRGGISANHIDHMHILFKKNAVWPTSLTNASIGSSPARPNPVPAKPVSKWNGITFPGISMFRIGLKSDATAILQGRLKLHGFDPGPLDSYFGEKTKAAVKAYQKSKKWTGDDADGVPGPVTWQELLKPPNAKKPPQGRSIAQMATEVILGKHGTGHDNRRKSLGISNALYQKVRAEVNRRM